MAESMSVEKNKFLFLHDSTTSFRPGWGGETWKMREWVCQSMCTRNMTESLKNESRGTWLVILPFTPVTMTQHLQTQCYNIIRPSSVCVCVCEGNTSYMGSVSEFQASIRDSLTSTTVTVISGHIWAITLHVGPPTYPAPMQQILFIWTIWIQKVRWRMTTVNGHNLDYLNPRYVLTDSSCYSLTSNNHNRARS